MRDVLDAFHPLIAGWFRERFGAPTQPQVAGWPRIAAGEDVLIAAPTGSGKTLAAFLACLDDLVRRGLERSLAADGTAILYISPLKALSNDVHRNLEAPLAELAQYAAARGVAFPEIRVGVRTGDTPPGERAKMAKRPPHILVTTPESLFILLTSEKGRAALGGLRTVIVDEIHAVAGDKRGAHLALSLERLDRLVRQISGRAPVRVGLSATQRPIERIARLLVGTRRPLPFIADTGHRRELDLAIEITDDELGAVASNEQFGRVYDRIGELVTQHRSTIVFVNTRRLVERAAAALEQRLGAEHVVAHHGSMSRALRLAAEQKLKYGQVKCAVATASLELGIDVGAVDLVVQLGSPRAIATLLQRVGRSGHTLGGTPKGRLFALTRDQLVECAALVRGVRRGNLDEITLREAPLDILAQQIVATCAAEEISEFELAVMIRGATPYAGLADDQLEQILTMVSEGVSDRRGRAGAHVHRDRIAGVLRGRRGARLAAITSGGAIPDNNNYTVVQWPEEIQVGTIDEDFAIESSAGDIFQLGNTAWRIRRVEAGRVLVEDAKGLPPTIPFWFGEAPARTRELSDEVSALRGAIDRRLGHVLGDRFDRPVDFVDHRAFATGAHDATATGATGPIGANGAHGAIANGAIGAGAAGATGATGANGGHGAVANRAIGATGPADAIGATGAPGAHGAIATGAAGATDPADALGANGAAGAANGAIGATAAGDSVVRDPDIEAMRTVDDVAAWLAAEASMSTRAADQMIAYLAAGRAALGALPRKDLVIAERFFDEAGGMQMILHAPFGGRVNRAWGLALRKKFCRTFDFELQAAATDDGIVISLGQPHSFALETVFAFVPSHQAEDTLVQALLDRPMFEIRWRWNVTRSLTVLRRRAGKKVPPHLIKMRAADTLSVVFPQAQACPENLPGSLPGMPGEREIPDHPLVFETIRDCLVEAMDLAGFRAVLEQLERGEIQVIARDTVEPSLLSHELINANPYAYLDDAPLEERRTRAVSLRRGLPAAITGDDSIGTLDAAAITAATGEAAPVVRNVDELHDALLGLWLVPEAFGRALAPEAGDWFAALCATGRACHVRWGEHVAWVATERIGGARAVLGEAVECEPAIPTPVWAARPEREAAIVKIASAHLDHRGPIATRALAAELGLPVHDVLVALLALEADGAILRGTFTTPISRAATSARDAVAAADDTAALFDLEWCNRRILARIHRLTLARLRKEIEPVSAAGLQRFLLRWQRVARNSQLIGADGLARVLEQLQGFETASGAWERELFPARICNYDPSWLDQMCLAGQVVWCRLSPRKPVTETDADVAEADAAEVGVETAIANTLDERPRARGRRPGPPRLVAPLRDMFGDHYDIAEASAEAARRAGATREQIAAAATAAITDNVPVRACQVITSLVTATAMLRNAGSDDHATCELGMPAIPSAPIAATNAGLTSQRTSSGTSVEVSATGGGLISGTDAPLQGERASSQRTSSGTTAKVSSIDDGLISGTDALLRGVHRSDNDREISRPSTEPQSAASPVSSIDDDLISGTDAPLQGERASSQRTSSGTTAEVSSIEDGLISGTDGQLRSEDDREISRPSTEPRGAASSVSSIDDDLISRTDAPLQGARAASERTSRGVAAKVSSIDDGLISGIDGRLHDALRSELASATTPVESSIDDGLISRTDAPLQGERASSQRTSSGTTAKVSSIDDGLISGTDALPRDAHRSDNDREISRPATEARRAASPVMSSIDDDLISGTDAPLRGASSQRTSSGTTAEVSSIEDGLISGTDALLRGVHRSREISRPATEARRAASPVVSSIDDDLISGTDAPLQGARAASERTLCGVAAKVSSIDDGLISGTDGRLHDALRSELASATTPVESSIDDGLMSGDGAFLADDLSDADREIARAFAALDEDDDDRRLWIEAQSDRDVWMRKRVRGSSQSTLRLASSVPKLGSVARAVAQPSSAAPRPGENGSSPETGSAGRGSRSPAADGSQAPSSTGRDSARTPTRSTPESQPSYTVSTAHSVARAESSPRGSSAPPSGLLARGSGPNRAAGPGSTSAVGDGPGKASQPGRGARASRSAPSRSAPLALMLRRDVTWLRAAAAIDCSDAAPLGAAAARVRDHLAHAGASFLPDLVATIDLPPDAIEEALWELVGAGLATADGFASLRVLVDRKRGEVKSHFDRTTTVPLAPAPAVRSWQDAIRKARTSDRSRPGTALRSLPTAAGRWSMLPAIAPDAMDAEASARQLLHRYGVVFRDLVTRESCLPPWRELLVALRRLEARGEIRGGRFVNGFVGEQFALPEALDELRAVRNPGANPDVCRVAATDPLNLVGVLSPGPRVPALVGNAVLYIDGHAVASLEAGAVVQRAPIPPGARIDDDLTYHPPPRPVHISVQAALPL